MSRPWLTALRDEHGIVHWAPQFSANGVQVAWDQHAEQVERWMWCEQGIIRVWPRGSRVSTSTQHVTCLMCLAVGTIKEEQEWWWSRA